MEEYPSAQAWFSREAATSVLFHPPRGFCPECMSSRVRVEGWRVEGPCTRSQRFTWVSAMLFAIGFPTRWRLLRLGVDFGFSPISSVFSSRGRDRTEVEPVHDRDDTGRVLLFFRRAEK